MRQIISIGVILVFVLVRGHVRAQAIPQMIPYTGTVTVKGVPFNGTGQFKFAIVNGHVDCQIDPAGENCLAFWYNSGAGPLSARVVVPTDAIPLTVTNGMFSVKLGDTTLTNMKALPVSIFNNTQTFLRVWFNDGVAGFQHLAPDRQLVSVPYAYRADRADVADVANQVVAGGITTTMIKENTVNTTHIADNTIKISDLDFDLATQAELDIHKGSGDHDSRYVLKTGDTLTGSITTPGISYSNGGGGATGLSRSHPVGNLIEVGSLSSSSLTFITNATEQMRIDSDGNVGIGTTTPQAKLDLEGDLDLSGNNITNLGIPFTGGRPIWRLVYVDAFDNGTTEGWSGTTILTCETAKLLYCQNSCLATKTFDLTGVPHTEVMIKVGWWAIGTSVGMQIAIDNSTVSGGNAGSASLSTAYGSYYNKCNGEFNSGMNAGPFYTIGKRTHKASGVTVGVNGGAYLGIDTVEIWVK